MKAAPFHKVLERNQGMQRGFAKQSTDSGLQGVGQRPAVFAGMEGSATRSYGSNIRKENCRC